MGIRNEETVDRTLLSSRIHGPATAHTDATPPPVMTTEDSNADLPCALSSQAGYAIAPSGDKDNMIFSLFQSLFHCDVLEYVDMEVSNDTGTTTIHLVSKSTSYVNPANGHVLTKRCGKYERTVNDLPLKDMKCVLKITANKYRDTEEEKATGKPRVIVSEQFDGLTRKYGRDSIQLEEEIVRTYATSYSSIAARASLENKMVSISNSKIIRKFSNCDLEVNREGVKHLMIDDVLEYTNEEGEKVYLTGIHNGDNCLLLEYVESRNSQQVAETLAKYHDLVSVSCDMADCYIEAIRKTSEILGRTVTTIVDKFHFTMSQRKATQKDFYALKEAVIMKEIQLNSGVDVDTEDLGLSIPLSQTNAEPTDRKKALFEEVHSLKEQNPDYTYTDIARLTGLCPETVALYLTQEQPKGNRRHNYMDLWDYLDVIHDCQLKGLWMEDIHRALLEAMKKDGSGKTCSLSTVRKFMKASYPKYTNKLAKQIREGKTALPGGNVCPIILSALQILNSKRVKYFLSSKKYGYMFVQDKAEGDGSVENAGRKDPEVKGHWEPTEDRKVFQAICDMSPTLAKLVQLNYEMSDTLAGKPGTSMDKWRKMAEESGFEYTLKFLKTFDRYREYVQAGIDTGRTNSACEGVNYGKSHVM